MTVPAAQFVVVVRGTSVTIRTAARPDAAARVHSHARCQDNSSRSPLPRDARAGPDAGVRRARARVQAHGGGDVGSGADALGVGCERGGDVLLVVVAAVYGGGQQS